MSLKFSQIQPLVSMVTDRVMMGKSVSSLFLGCFSSTPQPLYNKVRYNTVLDITRISAGPQMVIKDLFSYIAVHFTLVITRFR